MYNKIASIILNLAKAQGSGTVFVSQPDSEREKLAGKLFVLAEIEGKKSDIDKMLSFLISELEENYYQDEKILLIGKVEGLKAENIFEAALAKSNKSLNEFLKDHKIKLDPAATNLSVGVVCGSKIHFSSFGRNRSLLIYRRPKGYEIINVDADAKISEAKTSKDPKKSARQTNLFSSVISGEVPLGSYFVFASESLPEYLSGLELVNIITKLPPIVAAGQIKNVLAKMNNYVPFLGIIIKNTNEEPNKKLEEIPSLPKSAHNSISSLNNTEARTEHMLAPAGLVNINNFKKIAKNLFKTKQGPRKNVSKNEIGSESTASSGYINTAKKNKLLNLPNSSSFLKPPKVFLKKGSRNFLSGTKAFISFVPRLFSPSFWRGLSAGTISWFKNLNTRNTILFASLILVLLVMTFGIIRTNKQKQEKADLNSFNIALSEIEEKEALIDSYLLYDNKEGAVNVLKNIENLSNDLPENSDYQIEAKGELQERITKLQDKILGIKRIDDITPIADYSELAVTSLVKAPDNIYINSDNSIYSLANDLKDKEKIDINTSNISASRLFKSVAGLNSIYYQAKDKVFVLNPKDNSIKDYTLGSYNEDEAYSSFDIYNNTIYLVANNKNQIYRYSTNFSSRTDWFSEDVDLSQVRDIYIDGSIYALNKDGRVSKFNKGKVETYSSQALEPQTENARKLRGDDSNLYILADNNRFIIVDKQSAKIKEQYIFNNLNISDFSLSADAKTLYLLADSKLYSLAL